MVVLTTLMATAVRLVPVVSALGAHPMVAIASLIVAVVVAAMMTIAISLLIRLGVGGMRLLVAAVTAKRLLSRRFEVAVT